MALQTPRSETKESEDMLQEQRHIPAAYGEDHTRADIHTAARGGPPHWSKWVFPEGTVARGQPTQEQVYPEGLQPVEGPTLEQGRSVEEGAAEQSCYGLTPSLRHWSCREEVEELGMKE
ncbi:hypothetical protein GRJ2_001052600 [Grus japonensis]|uniref:Uncharacterized protein n=1 Tax=Grus japonensis TaxID=30415 RepID=A0ABC9WKW1_GRUJA